MELIVTIKDTTVSKVNLAVWLRSVVPIFNVSDALSVSNALLKGETWRPSDNGYFDLLRIQQNNPYCNIVVEVEEDPISKSFALQASYQELMKKGAEGDAEAAIAYCKLELENKINHGVYG